MTSSFFAPEVDPSKILEDGFSAWLSTHCEPVDGAREFGDIVVFEDTRLTRHPFAMIYVADGLLFGRRPTLYSPWELLPEIAIAPLNYRLRENPATVYRVRSETSLPDNEASIATDSSPEEWFPEDALPTSLRDAIIDVSYQRGTGLAVSDYGALYLQAPSDRTAGLPRPRPHTLNPSSPQPRSPLFRQRLH